MLHEQIKKGARGALKERNASLLKALRNIIAALTNDAVARGKTPSGILTDEEVVAVITRLSKQRKESIEQFEKGGRMELAQEEKEELAHLQKYLPEMMSEDEIKKVVFTKKTELDISDKSGIGKLVGAVMKELKGKADGSAVKKAVEESF